MLHRFARRSSPSALSISMMMSSSASASAASAATEKSLLVSQKDKCMIVELNRPKALNALSVEMCVDMNNLLRNTINSADSQVGAFIMKGVGGKAFCAGGDVKSIWQELMDKGAPSDNVLGSVGALHADFFRTEYIMNYLLGTSARPQVSIWDGIIMGGGVGISVLGKFRVATEKSLFAMPETAIGLFPDVGSSSWLPHLKDGFGQYIGMTGARLGAADLMYTGIATHFVNSDRLEDLEKALVSGVTSTNPLEATSQVKAILDSFQTTSPDDARATMIKNESVIIQCFGNAPSGVEEIMQRLEAASSTSEFAKKTHATMSKMSPRSLKVTLRQLHEGKSKTLKEGLEMEFGIVLRCMQATDFREGIRALLVDKDNQPKWSPESISDVSTEQVDNYFAPLPANELILK